MEMETKAQLVSAVREWVRIDAELCALQKEISSRRKEKKTKTKKPISKASLINSLSSYFDGNAEKAVEVGTFILDNREDVVREKIVKK